MNTPSALRESPSAPPRTASVAPAVRVVAAWVALALAEAGFAQQRAQAEEPAQAAQGYFPATERASEAPSDPVMQWKREKLPEILAEFAKDVPLLDHDEFMIREGAQKRIHDALKLVSEFMNPLPAEVERALQGALAYDPAKHSVEQRARLRYANGFAEMHAVSAPTRVPLGVSTPALQAMKQLQSHTGIAIDYSALPDAERVLAARMIGAKENAYVQLIARVCRELNAYPVAGDTHDVVVLRAQQREVARQVFSDPSGRFLCVLEQSEKEPMPTLRVFTDPQMVYTTIEHAVSVHTPQQYNVSVEPTVQQQWSNATPQLRGPQRSVSTYQYCGPGWEMDVEEAFDEPGIFLRGSLLGMPKEFDLPLNADEDLDVGTQRARARYDAEKKQVVVRLKSTDPHDAPGICWSETAMTANRFTLVHGDATEGRSERGELVYMPEEGHVFDARIPAEQQPKSVRMRAYTYLSDWDEAPRGDGIFIPLPVRK